jgi:acetyl esterase/lipase
MIALPLPALLALLRLSGRRRRFESEEQLRKAVARDRIGPTATPRRTFRKLRVDCRRIQEHDYWVLRPRHASTTARVLYLHGGAYVARISRVHWDFLAQLVVRTGCSVHVPMYPLAPEHTHQPALSLLDEVSRELLDESPCGTGPVLMGDSAGGGLALALAQRIVAQGHAPPRDVILISPWLDLTLEHAARAATEIDDPWLALPGLRAAARWWAGDADPASPRLSPLYGRLSGLGRLSIFIGTRDLFLAECRELRERAWRAGTDAMLYEAPGMPHVWPLLPLAGACETRRTIWRILAGAPENEA